LNSKISESSCLTLLQYVTDVKISGVTQIRRIDYLAFARDMRLAYKDRKKRKTLEVSFVCKKGRKKKTKPNKSDC